MPRRVQSKIAPSRQCGIAGEESTTDFADRTDEFSRHLLNCFLAASLFLCVAVCLLWVRSYFATEWAGLAVLRPSNGDPDAYRPPVVWTQGADGLVPDRMIHDFDFSDYYVAYGVTAYRGRLAIGVSELSDGVTKHFRGVEFFHLARPGRTRPTLSDLWSFDFHWDRAQDWLIMIRWRREVEIPCWLAAVTFAALPVARFARRRRWRSRRARGSCPGCGYDLRATPERCPECGAVPAAG